MLPYDALKSPTHGSGEPVFAAFTVDAGSRTDGLTSITVTYYDVLGPYGQLEPFETFTLRRTRSDARRRSGPTS